MNAFTGFVSSHALNPEKYPHKLVCEYSYLHEQLKSKENSNTIFFLIASWKCNICECLFFLMTDDCGHPSVIVNLVYEARVLFISSIYSILNFNSAFALYCRFPYESKIDMNENKASTVLLLLLVLIGVLLASTLPDSDSK